MWDVKFINDNWFNIPKLCFTLTMWDVKENFDEIIYGVDFGFTLTMWDVKLIERENYTQIFKVLP